MNVIGYLAAENGLGEAARLMVKCAEEAHIPVGTSVLRRIPTRQNIEPPSGNGKLHDFNVICIPAQANQAFTHGDPMAFQGTVRNVWYLFWELEAIPPVIRWNAHLFDEIWTASRFTELALRKSLNVRVRYVPLPLWQELPAIKVRRTDLGLPESPFMFLFSWDYFSSVSRKNPFGVVNAYKAAFEPSDGAILVLKSINASGAADHHQRLLARCQDRGDIIILDNYLTREQMDGLPAVCDAYVSLHRSEGLGLTMAEAMRHGKPVIATNYGGNVDFLTSENAILIPWTYSPLESGLVGDYENIQCNWAEPDESAAARAMRQLFDDRDLCWRLGEEGRSTLLRRHTIEAVAPRWRQAYEEAGRSPGRWRARLLTRALTLLGRVHRRIKSRKGS